MMGIDADYGMSRSYQAGSWPTFVVVDAEGIIRFDGFDSDKDLYAVRRCIRQLLLSPGTQAAQVSEQLSDGGIAFPPDVLAWRQARRERSPRLAFQPSGTAQVVYDRLQGPY